MYPFRAFRVFAVCALVALATGLVRAEALAAVPGEAETIVLPKYEVKTERVLPPIEKWQYVALPGFEILSDISRRNTEVFVRDFYLLQQVAQILLPAVRERASLPSYIVLCGSRKDFERLVRKGGMDEAYDPVTGSLLSDGERNAMVVDFVSSDDRSVSDGAGDGSFRRFYLQYFRMLIRQSFKKELPFWLEEGMVQLFASVDFSNRSISFAKVGGDEGNSGSGAADAPEVPDSAVNGGAGASGRPGSFNAFFRRRAIIPLKEFFAVTADMPVEQRPPGYTMQAYLFTHLCLYGRGQRYVKPFHDLVQQSKGGAVTEEVFKKCFGMTFGSMQKEMRGYVEFTDYKAIEMTAKKKSEGLAEAPAFSVRAAGDAESSRIVGEVLRMSGQGEAALNRLIAPYVRGQYDADLLAALGLAELEVGRTERARKFLEAAVREKTSRTRAYLEVGKLRATEITTRAENEGRPLTVREAEFLREPLYEGLRHPPSLPGLCAFLVRVWLISPDLPDRGQFDELVALGRSHCTDLGLVYRVAELGLKCGRHEVSRQFIAFGVTNSTDEKSRARFEALSHLLPATSPTPQK